MTDPRSGLPPGLDAYKTLQVDPEADPDVIQASYRASARTRPSHARAAPCGGRSRGDRSALAAGLERCRHDL